MNTKIIGIALATIAVMGVSGTALAYRGDYQAKGPNATPEREAQMTQAMTTNNYTLWKSLMGDRGAAKKVTEQNFSQFTEAWKLGKAGNNAAAKEIRSKLGLGAKDGSGAQSGQGQGQGRSNGAHQGNGAGNRVGQK